MGGLYYLMGPRGPKWDTGSIVILTRWHREFLTVGPLRIEYP